MTGSDERAREDRFWLIVHEPGNVPDRKGSWPRADLPKVMREFIAARPDAYLTVLTVGADGTPDVQHGPEALQMADGRSMSVGSKHNARTKAAHSAALAASRPTDAGAGEPSHGMTAKTEVDRVAILLFEAFAKAEPREGITLYPTSYWATFADMARAIIADKALATQKPPVDEAPCCPISPDGRHQVDTSMEAGPNNCFYCSAAMGAEA